MLSDHARAELLLTFQAELAEHCQALTRALLRLEKEPEPNEQRELLDAAFRAAHSTKGGARSVGLPAIEALAHGLESVLGAVRRGAVELSPTLFDLLYAVIDTVAGAGPDLAHEDVLASEQAALLRQLEAVTAASAPAQPGGEMAPQTSASNGSAAPPTPPRPNDGASSAAAQAQPSRDPVAGAGTPRREQSRDRAREAGQAAGAADTVRLPAARIDYLLEQTGELVVPRLEIAGALTMLRELLVVVESWQEAWTQLRPYLRQLESYVNPGSSRRPAYTPQPPDTDQPQTGQPWDGFRPLLRFLDRNETELASLNTVLSAIQERINGSTEQLGMLTGELHSSVKHLRMVPFQQLTERLERTARDLARRANKEARLLLIGGETELDRRVLEELQDPLLHLIRNALDHGIESPAERRRRGKPLAGRVVVAAAQRAGMIEIEVEDDGAGLDISAIRRTAQEHNLASQAELAAMPDQELLRFIFLPGFSTRDDVSEVSGRGVGLDVVARNVERLSGQVEVTATPGLGTSFTIRLPLTLATTRAILIAAADGLYALPTSSVARVVQPHTDNLKLHNVGGRPVLMDAGVAVPVAALADVLQLRSAPAVVNRDGAQLLALVMAGGQRVAVIIDRVVDEQEIVVKPLGYPLLRVPFFSGATILGVGRVIPILNPADLVRAVSKTTASSTQRPTPPTDGGQPDAPRRKRVLVADDSLTARTLERYILEAAGYEVELAQDGAAALALLEERNYDVLVSDIEMPLLDGIALTERLRAEPRFRELPVILVTSLASPEDQERGLQAGADAYIVKSAFDQDHLLRTIRELI